MKLKEGQIYRLVLLNHLPSGKYICLGKYHDGSYNFVGQFSGRQILIKRKDFKVIK